MTDKDFVTFRESKQMIHDKANEFTPIFNELKEGIASIKDSLLEIKITNAEQNQKIEHSNGFRLAQEAYNKSLEKLVIDNMKDTDIKLEDKLNKHISITIFLFIFSMIGGFFLWTSNSLDSIDERLDNFTVDVQIIKGMFQQLDKL